MTPLAVAPQSSTGSQGAAPSSRLAKAAHEFESMLLTTLMTAMKGGLGSDSDSQDAAHDTVNGLGTQAMAEALSAKGGLGIASLVLRQLSHSNSSK